jgi:hypothetical protein
LNRALLIGTTRENGLGILYNLGELMALAVVLATGLTLDPLEHVFQLDAQSL